MQKQCWREHQLLTLQRDHSHDAGSAGITSYVLTQQGIPRKIGVIDLLCFRVLWEQIFFCRSKTTKHCDCLYEVFIVCQIRRT